MMKKNGFTLAEVLITLAIIGVVATLTLPSLMSNTAEQQAITAFRKSMNTLNEAAQMNAAQEGFDYSQLGESGDGGIKADATPGTDNIYNDTTGNVNPSLWALLASRTQVDIPTSVEASKTSGAGHIPGECNTFKQVLFKDGTALCYDTQSGTEGTSNTYFNVIIDTNGAKGPNRISTCGRQDCQKKERQINDQFRAHLRGTNAGPGYISKVDDNGVITLATDKKDYAANWAMRK